MDGNQKSPTSDRFGSENLISKIVNQSSIATQQLEGQGSISILAYLSLSIHSTTFPKAPAPSVNTTSSVEDRQTFI